MALPTTAHQSLPHSPPGPPDTGSDSSAEATQFFCDGLQSQKASQSLSRDSAVIFFPLPSCLFNPLAKSPRGENL